MEVERESRRREVGREGEKSERRVGRDIQWWLAKWSGSETDLIATTNIICGLISLI